MSDRPTIPINLPVTAGFAIMGVFATTFFPVWVQAAFFAGGAAFVIFGALRASWYYRRLWGKYMIGSILMIIVGMLTVVGGGLIGWLGFQGLKGAFQPRPVATKNGGDLTPQTLAQAIVQAYDIIRDGKTVEPTEEPAEEPTPTSLPNLKVKKPALPSPSPTPSPTPVLPTVTPNPQAVSPSQPAEVVNTTPNERRLSRQQQSSLIQLLSLLSKSVSSSLIMSTMSDNEAYQYASDFQKVFVRAGLQPSMSNDNPHTPSEIGVMIEVNNTTPPNILASVREALTKVGIQATTVSRTNAIAAPIVLYIGPNPNGP